MYITYVCVVCACLCIYFLQDVDIVNKDSFWISKLDFICVEQGCPVPHTMECSICKV